MYFIFFERHNAQSILVQYFVPKTENSLFMLEENENCFLFS